MTIFWWLVVGHMLFDYPIQSDFLAKGKNHRNPLPGIPWGWCLAAHSLIHGGAVALITGSVVMGVIETVFHGWIDWLKCDGQIGFHQDQVIHLFCKAVFALAASYGVFS